MGTAMTYTLVVIPGGDDPRNFRTLKGAVKAGERAALEYRWSGSMAPDWHVRNNQTGRVVFDSHYGSDVPRGARAGLRACLPCGPRARGGRASGHVRALAKVVLPRRGASRRVSLLIRGGEYAGIEFAPNPNEEYRLSRRMGRVVPVEFWPDDQFASVLWDEVEESGSRAAGVGRQRGQRNGGEVAATILRQLGGTGRLQAMIGVRQFFSYNPSAGPGEGWILGGVSFSFPNRAPRPNYVKITLAGDDTYTVRFLRHGRGRGNYKDLGTFSGIYADQLRELFDRQTGLYLSL